MVGEGHLEGCVPACRLLPAAAAATAAATAAAAAAAAAAGRMIWAGKALRQALAEVGETTRQR